MAEASGKGKTKQSYTIQFRKDVGRMQLIIVIELLLQNLIFNQTCKRMEKCSRKVYLSES